MRVRHLLPAVVALVGAVAAAEVSLEVPHPDLGRLDPSLAREIEEARGALDGRLRSGAEPFAVAGAYGELGKVYAAYDLLQAAAACFENARRLDVDNPTWHYYAGYVRQRQGRAGDAEDAFQHVLMLEPDDAATRLRLAELLLAQGELDRARNLFEDVADLPGSAAAGRAGLGRVALAESDPETALEHLSAALALQPEATSLHHARGMALRALGDTEAARDELAAAGPRAVHFVDPLIDSLEPQGVSGLLRRGIEAMGRGEPAAAAELYRQALEIAPDSARLLRHLAAAQTRLGDEAGAVDAYRRAAELEPDSALAQLRLGGALARLYGPVETTRQALERAVELAPDFVSARVQYGEVLASAGATAAARGQFEAALAIDPESRFARLGLARTLMRSGAAPAAVQLLEEMHARVPDDGLVTFELARALLASGERERAISMLEMAVAGSLLPPSDALARLDLANLLLETGELERAETLYQDAVTRSPNLADAWFNLGTIQARYGRPAEAAESFGRAVALVPDDAVLVEARTRALVEAGRCEIAAVELESAVERLAEARSLENLLARCLAACPEASVRDGERAVELASRLLSAEPALDRAETLAMALAEVGRFAEAVALQERLVTEASSAGREDLRAVFEERLELYRQERPFRLPSP